MLVLEWCRARLRPGGAAVMENVGRHRDIVCGVGGFVVLDGGKGELAGSAGRDWGPKDGDYED